jgi:hypothetical protein
MSPISNRKRLTYGLALGAVVAAGATAATNVVGCGTSNTNTVSYATTDPYVYYAYYPADVAVASVYWADTWVYAGLYALTSGATPSTYPGGGGTITSGPDGGTAETGTGGFDGGAAGAAGAGGAGGSGGSIAAPAAVVTTVGDAIRALARGEAVCPNQVSVTTKSSAPICVGGPSPERAGVTIVFQGCHTPGGGLIDGTIDVTSTRTASAPNCTSATSIAFSHTTTITNLSYTAPGGAKLVIPLQNDTGQNAYVFGQAPTSIIVSSMGRLQTYDADGALVSDHDFQGTPSISFAGTTTGYTVDGPFSATDNLNAGHGLTLTLMGLQRVTSCCRPAGGSIEVVQTSGSTVTHTWAFGPSCGEVVVDGQAATSLPACL